jgi:hypothetical protein
LKQNNSITVACKLAVSPTQQNVAPREPVLSWVLSYTNASTGAREERCGIVEAELTSDLQAAAEPGDAPARACVLQVKASLLDRKVRLLIPLSLLSNRQVVARLDEKNNDAALRLKRDVIQMLEEAASLNPDGYAPVMLRAARKTLARMEKGGRRNVRKAAHYQAYLVRMDSADAMRAAAKYADEPEDDGDDSSGGEEGICPAAGNRGGRRQLFDSGDWSQGFGK